MPSLLQYLFKLSIGLAVVYLFYYFLLRRLTFYNLNRWFLLIYSACSFIIPFINIASLLESDTTYIVQYIPMVTGISARPVINETVPFWTRAISLMQVLITTGIIIMIGRIGMQFFSYRRMRGQSRLLMDEEVKIFQVDAHIIPFSIGHSIFINQQLHTETELREIIRHEFIHVKQGHTLDIIFGECICAMNWFNPFAWLVRKAIRQNLEFIADSKVLESGLDRRTYQHMLLKVMGQSSFRITSQFNFSSLKKRIAMMNKKESAKKHLLRLLLVLPVLAIVLLAFRGTRQVIPTPFTFRPVALLNDTVPAPPPPLPPTAPNPPLDPLHEFLQRNPTVKEVSSKDGHLIIYLKSGKKENYNMNDEAEMTRLREKYGEIPTPPPPPVIMLKPGLHPDVRSLHIENSTVRLELKNGSVENYNLSNPAERASFEKKYGGIMSIAPTEEEQREREIMEMKAAREMQLDAVRGAEEAEMMKRKFTEEAMRHALEKEMVQQKSRQEMMLQMAREDEIFRKQMDLKVAREAQMNEIRARRAADLQEQMEKIAQLDAAAGQNSRNSQIRQLEVQRMELKRMMQDLKLKEEALSQQLEQLKRNASTKD